MQNRILAVALVVGTTVVGLLIGSASADNVSVAISTPGVNFGLNVGSPPPLVTVPGLPVYHAPAVPHNYFVYGNYYYLFHEGTWFYSSHHNGPWFSLVIHQVPRPILAVPVTYYKKVPPGHAKWKGGPPDWDDHHKGKKKHKDKHKSKHRDKHDD